MYFPVQFSVRSTRRKYLGYPFLLQGAQKAVGGGGGGGGGPEKKYPTFFFFFFLGTQKILGGGGHFSSLGGGAPTGKVTPLVLDYENDVEGFYRVFESSSKPYS